MHQVYQAYADFWEQFTNPLTGEPIKAYREGFANEETKEGVKPAPFPYITYPTELPEAFSNSFLTASVWDSSATDPGSLSVVLDVMRQIKEQMPFGGSANLQLDDGMVRLFYQSSRTMSDPDKTVVRGAVSFMVRSNYGGVK